MSLCSSLHQTATQTDRKHHLQHGREKKNKHKYRGSLEGTKFLSSQSKYLHKYSIRAEEPIFVISEILVCEDMEKKEQKAHRDAARCLFSFVFQAVTKIVSVSQKSFTFLFCLQLMSKTSKCNETRCYYEMVAFLQFPIENKSISINTEVPHGMFPQLRQAAFSP